MMKKIITKKIITISLVLAMLAALIPISLAESGDTTTDSGDVTPYEGFFGADSPLYQVKIFIQNMDVYFSFNNKDKMKKQMNYANERMSEMLAAQKKKNPNAVGAAASEHSKVIDKLEETIKTIALDEGIPASDFEELEFMLQHHKDCIEWTIHEGEMSEPVLTQVKNADNKVLGLKNGMPFYYYKVTVTNDDGTTTSTELYYFAPPGQNNKNSKIPPGLAKKSYVVCASKSWPWDDIYPMSTKVKGNGNGNKK